MSRISNFWIDDAVTDKGNNYNCCGCSACDNACPKNAISIKSDIEGFLYPQIDNNKCIDCGICVKVCPVVNECESKAPYIKTFAGYSTNEDVMNKSTSGGFVSTLSQYIIDRGGVVYGVVFDDEYSHTYYTKATSYAQLSQLAGSKYIQSDKRDVFSQIKKDLDNQSEVLFVGCPCDVSALKRYLRKEYDKLLTCELVCMGVTSPRIAIDYKKWSEKHNHSRLVSMNMRSKKKGWFVPHLEEHFANGKIKCETLFGTYIGYGFQVFNRPSCFQCQYRDTTGVGDIRVGDFWGIKESDEFWNPNGVSGIYVRSEKGLKSVEDLSKYDFQLFETDYFLATRSNMSSYMNKPMKFRLLRDKFAEVYIQQDKGLPAACRATASLSFWVKRYVPDSFHALLKKVYHNVVDKKRK